MDVTWIGFPCCVLVGCACEYQAFHCYSPRELEVETLTRGWGGGLKPDFPG